MGLLGLPHKFTPRRRLILYFDFSRFVIVSDLSLFDVRFVVPVGPQGRGVAPTFPGMAAEYKKKGADVKDRAVDALAWFEFGIPIEEIPPAFMKVIGRKCPAVLLKLVRGRFMGVAQWVHGGFAGKFMRFGQVTGFACRNDIGPNRFPTGNARDNMVERQSLGRQFLAAILACECISEENVEAGERGPARCRDILFQRNDAG